MSKFKEALERQKTLLLKSRASPIRKLKLLEAINRVIAAAERDAKAKTDGRIAEASERLT